MILECTQCHMRYLVADSAIGLLERMLPTEALPELGTVGLAGPARRGALVG